MVHYLRELFQKHYVKKFLTIEDLLSITLKYFEYKNDVISHINPVSGFGEKYTFIEVLTKLSTCRLDMNDGMPSIDTLLTYARKEDCDLLLRLQKETAIRYLNGRTFEDIMGSLPEILREYVRKGLSF
jgi:hypothetical protein